MLEIFYMNSDQLGDGLGITGSRRVEITGRAQMTSAFSTNDGLESYVRGLLEQRGWRFHNFNFQVNDLWKLVYLDFDISITAEVLNQYSDQQVADSISRELESTGYVANVYVTAKSPNSQQPSHTGYNPGGLLGGGGDGSGGAGDGNLLTDLFGTAGLTVGMFGLGVVVVLFLKR